MARFMVQGASVRTWNDRHSEARAAGLCGHCLTRPAWNGLSRCRQCWNDPKRLAALEKRNAERRKKTPARARLCAFDDCDRVTGNGHSYCTGHERQRRNEGGMSPLPLAYNLKHRPAWTQAKKDELVRMYHAGKTMPEMAAKLGHPLTTICGRVAKHRAQLAAARMTEGRPDRPLIPYPGVARCRCGLALDDDHRECDMPSIYAVAARRAAW